MLEDLKSIPTIEGKDAPKDAIYELSKKLGIRDTIIIEINRLSQEDKEEVEVSLRKIQKEVEEGKLGPTDQDQKIKNTLAGKYGIIVLKDDINKSSKGESPTISKLEGSTFRENNESEKRDKTLGERLAKVKELDPTIVSEELAKVKSAKPLTEDVKLTIAKSSNIPPDKIGEIIRKGDNPQVNNLIDTYYLSQQETINAIKVKLPKGKITTEFQELRASAREFGLPYTETVTNMKSLVLDKSDANQSNIINTVNSLTRGSQYTLVTRTGDRLTFSDPSNERYNYEIDMNRQPMKLAKRLNGLSISREIAPTIVDPARERNENKRNTVAQIVPTISRDTKEILSSKMADGSDITSPEIGGMLDNTLSHISLRNQQSAKLSRTMIETTGSILRMEQGRMNTLIQDKSKIDPLDPDIGAIKGTIIRITTLIESLQKIQEKTLIEEENPQSNTLLWDKNARDNLSWLTDNYFDRMGPAAQEAIDRIIALVNRDRTPSNQIQLGEALTPMSKDILERSIIKLGGTPDVLTSGDRLPRFQSHITEALLYKSGDRSIEGLLQKT